MTIALIAKDKDLTPWFSAFHAAFPDIKIIDGLATDSYVEQAEKPEQEISLEIDATRQETSNKVESNYLEKNNVKKAKEENNSNEETHSNEGFSIEEVTCVVVWKHPTGFLQRFPNLKLIVSMGAGVDQIFADDQLNREIPITRVVDSQLAQDMNEYLLSAILSCNRQLVTYAQLQKKQCWQPRSYRRLSETHVGILGLGQLGRSASQYLSSMGCRVSGWSRSDKKIPHVNCCHGDASLAELLRQVDIIVCLLPLTSSTKNLINQALLRHVKQGAYFINASRGALVNDDDLIEALELGQLSGACLDVFNEEPLPEQHHFWSRNDLLMTPHVASLTDPQSVVCQIVDNYHCALRGEALLNQVDPKLEY